MIYQQQNQIYQTTPTVTLAYPDPCNPGDLGIAWCFCAAGTLPGSVTDTQGNIWCLGNQLQETDSSLNCYICAKLTGGTTSITTSFGTSSGIDVSVHLEEYSYLDPAASIIIQSVRTHSLSVVSWGIFGSYLWGTGIPLPNYCASVASGVQQNVTLTAFLALYDSQAPPHGWGNGNSTVRSFTEQSNGSTVSGEYVVSGASQRIFDPSFGIIYPIAPSSTPPGIQNIGFMVMEY